MLSHLKRERELTLSHWRYRLIHWTWGINPSTPQESKLPGFLYTHYCPLFHLSNAIALMSPFILMAKIVLQLCRGVKKLFKPLKKIINTAAAKKQEQHNCEALAKIEKERKAKLKKAFINAVKKYIEKTENELDAKNFRKFYLSYEYSELSSNYSNDKEESEKLFNKIVAKIARKIEEEKIEAKIRQERMIMWLNIIQPITKVVGLILMVAAVAGLLYGLYLGLPYFIYGVCEIAKATWWFMFNFNWIEFIYGLAKVGISATIGGAIIYFTVKALFKLLQKSKIGKIFYSFVSIISDMGGSIVGAIGATIEGFLNGISMFYENNCPPVKIVEKED